MIDISMHVTNGIVIPNCKAMHNEIIDTFKSQLTKLKDHLNVQISFVVSLVHLINSLCRVAS